MNCPIDAGIVHPATEKEPNSYCCKRNSAPECSFQKIHCTARTPDTLHTQQLNVRLIFSFYMVLLVKLNLYSRFIAATRHWLSTDDLVIFIREIVTCNKYLRKHTRCAKSLTRPNGKKIVGSQPFGVVACRETIPDVLLHQVNTKTL